MAAERVASAGSRAASARRCPGSGLDDAIPVLTRDPLATAESFCAANKDDAPIDELSDAELIRKASRELASATIVVAQGLMHRGDPACRGRHPAQFARQMCSGGQCWVSAGGNDAGGGRPRARGGERLRASQ